MSGGNIVAVCTLGVVALAFSAWIGYALGHVIGECDEARRILRYVDGTDVHDAVRRAVLGDHGLAP